MGKVRLSKNQLRREKAKKRKIEGGPSEDKEHTDINRKDFVSSEATKKDVSKETNTDSTATEANTQTTPEPVVADVGDPELFKQYQKVFAKFSGVDEAQKADEDAENQQLIVKETVESESDEFESEEEPEESERQARKKQKVSMAHLKAISKHPELIEWTDVDAKDPFFLVAIKQNVNIVPVPSHWSSKRAYLSAKRGIDKAPFQLPKYILDTGIQDMRNNVDEQTVKQQQREKVQPKMGKLDIDYQKLHDAFFKYQTKPKLLGFGDVYYEGRATTDDNEERIIHMRPGKLSRELLKALGLPEDGKTTPPWISTMASLGKPPTYEKLLIPGIDMAYANVPYLTNEDQYYTKNEDNHEHWGEVVAEESSEEESDEEEDEGEENDEEEIEKADPTLFDVESDTNEDIQNEIKIEPTKPTGPKSLYTVIQDDVNEAGDGVQYKFKKDEEVATVPEPLKEEKKETKKFKF